MNDIKPNTFYHVRSEFFNMNWIVETKIIYNQLMIRDIRAWMDNKAPLIISKDWMEASWINNYDIVARVDDVNLYMFIQLL